MLKKSFKVSHLCSPQYRSPDANEDGCDIDGDGVEVEVLGDLEGVGEAGDDHGEPGPGDDHHRGGDPARQGKHHVRCS